jgi:hypothetical protein
MAELNDVLADAIDTARRNEAPVELPLEAAQALAARLAPVSVGGVDVKALRRLLPSIIAALERLRRLDAIVAEAADSDSASSWEFRPARRHLATDPEDGPSTGEEGYAISEDGSDPQYLTWTPHKGGAELIVHRHNELVEALERMVGLADQEEGGRG